MLPQNKDQVWLQNVAPLEGPPLVLSQFVDSPLPNLASLSLHQTPPSSHFPLPTTTQEYFFSSLTQTHSPGPHFYSSDSNSDFVPLLYSTSLPRSSSCFPQNYTYFGEKLPSSHSTPPSNSQLQNSSPHSYQSPSRLQDFQSSTITPPTPTSPSRGIQSNSQPQQCPPSRSIRASGVTGGCVPSGVDPAEFKDPRELVEALADHVGRRKIALDLKLEFLWRLWLGTTGPAPVLEYPVCLVCLQPRTPSCPTTKYKKVPRLLAFPQLQHRAQGQESGPLRMGIGFGLRLSRGQAKALHLVPKNSPAGVEFKEEAPQCQQRQKPATRVSGSLRAVDLQSPKLSRCSRSLRQEPRQATASPKPRPSVSKRSVSLGSILQKLLS